MNDSNFQVQVTSPYLEHWKSLHRQLELLGQF